MSEVVRLTLVAHAMTDAMSAGRFPCDEPLNALGRRQIAAANDVGRADHVWCGPERRTVQTAELLDMHPQVEPLLADVDLGSWRGEDLESLDPALLAAWLTDPVAAPHDGEAIVGLIGRVRRWLESLTSAPTRHVAVTHPAVIRAALLVALDAPAKSFWRIDIAPLSRTVLHFRSHAWTFRVVD